MPSLTEKLREETLSSEHSSMRLYNGSRVHKAKYELVGGLCQCDWAFRLVFVLVQERSQSIVGHVEVNANGCQPDRLPASVEADGVHLQLRN